MPEEPHAQGVSIEEEYDPLFLHARRELKLTLVAWVMFGIWVIGVSWMLGRQTDSEAVGMTLGMPTWVFWGVAAPWLLANGFIFWFCFRYMEDDPLAEIADEETDGNRGPTEP